MADDEYIYVKYEVGIPRAYFEYYYDSSVDESLEAFIDDFKKGELPLEEAIDGMIRRVNFKRDNGKWVNLGLSDVDWDGPLEDD